MRDIMGKAESKYVLIRDGPEGECQSGQVQVHVQVTQEPEETQQQEQQQTAQSQVPDTNSSIIKMPLTVSLPAEEKTGIENKAASFTNQGVQTSDTESDSNNKTPAKLQEVKCGMKLTGLEKQEWSFTLYDFEGRGRVTKEDLARLMKSLYHSVGASLSGPSEGTKTLNLRLTVNPDMGSIENLPSPSKTVHVHHRHLHHEHRHRRKKHRSPSKQGQQNNFDLGMEDPTKGVLVDTSEQKISNLATDSSNNSSPRQPHSKVKFTPDRKCSTSPETRHRTPRRPKSSHKRLTKHSPLQPTENVLPVDQPSTSHAAATTDLSAKLLNLDMSEEQNTSESQGLLPNSSSQGHASPSIELQHKGSPEKSHRKKHRHRHKHRDDSYHEHQSPEKRHSKLHFEGAEYPDASRTLTTEQEHATTIVKQRTRSHALKARKSRPLSMPVDSGWIMGPGSPALDNTAALQRHEHHHVHEHHHHHHHYHWYQS